ncbi:DUF86 domain-containing protein [Paenibacillus hemerocallicola]|uniref:DUF86 domain-containing protein n=1 Tax=Paenibacillus hemerocallicola TaxID=1172614 RepID=A0A5C4SYN1_9BACL|nr:HepT-like ribonuclease domain-containing protein [Paenibacillus hemerocallicola]TNJ61861.1 DUF86 domain-containing protein [Paenibacillus hemerocallicola]
MYYVNHEQIGERLATIPVLSEAAGRLVAEWPESGPDLLLALAQERLLHLALELVTDAGSLLIDGFLMRDASSYEDIVEILRTEGVFPEELFEPLLELVRLRKPLVQEYARLERDSLYPLTRQLPELLSAFGQSVQRFIAKELA